MTTSWPRSASASSISTAANSAPPAALVVITETIFNRARFPYRLDQRSQRVDRVAPLGQLPPGCAHRSCPLAVREQRRSPRRRIRRDRAARRKCWSGRPSSSRPRGVPAGDDRKPVGECLDELQRGPAAVEQGNDGGAGAGVHGSQILDEPEHLDPLVGRRIDGAAPGDQQPHPGTATPRDRQDVVDKKPQSLAVRTVREVADEHENLSAGWLDRHDSSPHRRRWARIGS